MLKKIISLGIIGGAILIITGFSLSNNSVEEIIEEDVIVQADVIMPTKVSRPGCEELDRCYIPSEIVTEKGKQITWINEDSAFHSVTSGLYDSTN